jgi:hypothetical protein
LRVYTGDLTPPGGGRSTLAQRMSLPPPPSDASSSRAAVRNRSWSQWVVASPPHDGCEPSRDSWRWSSPSSVELRCWIPHAGQRQEHSMGGAGIRRSSAARSSTWSRPDGRSPRLLRRWALLGPRPVARDPLVDRRLVALGSPARRALHRPAQPVAQQRPDVGGVVAHAGQPLDHQRDAVNVHSSPTNPLAPAPSSRPARRRRAAHPTAAARAARALAAQGLRPAGLGGDTKPAGDLGLADASGEQPGGAPPPGLEPFAFSSCRRAARTVGMPAILTRRAAQHQLDPALLSPTHDPLWVSAAGSSRRARRRSWAAHRTP